LLCLHPEAVEPLLEELHEGFVEAIQEAYPYLTRPLLKDIGGPIYNQFTKGSI